MASTYSDVSTIPGLTVGSDLSASQYHAVKMASTANQILAVSASTDIAIGILMDAPNAAGVAARVAGLGTVTAVAGTSDLVAGQRVGYNTTGQVVDGNALTFGVALDDSSAIGDEVKVLLTGLS